MGRLPVPTPPHSDWRERLLWTSLAVGLIGLMLFGLVSLAQWGEHSRVAGSGPFGIDRLPGSTALAGELLVPLSPRSSAPLASVQVARAAPVEVAPVEVLPVRAPRARLPAVSASREAASRARFSRGANRKCKPVPGARTRQAVSLIERSGLLCEPGR